MRLHEVINEATLSGSAWFRPTSWHSTGMAYVIKDGNTHVVPSSGGGTLGMTSSPELLSGDWEVVSPDVVLNERAGLFQTSRSV